MKSLLFGLLGILLLTAEALPNEKPWSKPVNGLRGRLQVLARQVTIPRSAVFSLNSKMCLAFSAKKRSGSRPRPWNLTS